MTISNGQTIDANDHLNIYHTSGGGIIGKKGRWVIPVYINNASGVRTVKMALWGFKAGFGVGAVNYGVGEHLHGGVTTGSANTASSGTNIIADTGVPQFVQFHVDGTEIVDTLGDANTKGTTMFAATGTKTISEESAITGVTSATIYNTQYFGGALLDEITFSLKNSGGVYIKGYATVTYTDGSTHTTTERTTNSGSYVDHAETSHDTTKPIAKIEFYAYEDGSTISCFAKVKDVDFGGHWGVDGTTEWDTGWLDISSVISWTAGWHYIYVAEGGGVGGTLNYHVAINTGF